MKLQERIERARELHAKGYNCAQCVVMAFDDVYGVNADIVARQAAAFGAGFGSREHLCGAVSGMGMVLGLAEFNSPEDKKMIYDRVRILTNKFESINSALTCRELLTSRRKPCMGLIEDAITILDQEIGNKR